MFNVSFPTAQAEGIRSPAVEITDPTTSAFGRLTHGATRVQVLPGGDPPGHGQAVGLSPAWEPCGPDSSQHCSSSRGSACGVPS
jgi:hypothetical protein